MKDFTGVYSKYRYLIIQQLSRFFYGLSNLLAYSIKGIEVGNSCRFYGKTFFYRKPNSKIIIGHRCGFRSSQNSNLIGINRKCSISTLSEKAHIIIGNECGFSGTVIGAFSRIEIEDNVKCGANTLITDGDWHLDDPRAGKPSPILLEKNVWLGEGVKVLKGVTIGKNSVIGAGSIVTKNIPANVIAAGNPCKVLKSVDILYESKN